MCVKCQRSSDTAANLIITCGCGEAWHQLCHDPQVSEETASNPATFKCSTCVVEDKAQANYQAKLVKYREAKQQQSDLKKQRAEVERLRTRNLEGLPDFIKPELVGFGAGDASTDAVCALDKTTRASADPKNRGESISRNSVGRTCLIYCLSVSESSLACWWTFSFRCPKSSRIFRSSARQTGLSRGRHVSLLVSEAQNANMPVAARKLSYECSRKRHWKPLATQAFQATLQAGGCATDIAVDDRP